MKFIKFFSLISLLSIAINGNASGTLSWSDTSGSNSSFTDTSGVGADTQTFIPPSVVQPAELIVGRHSFFDSTAGSTLFSDAWAFTSGVTQKLKFEIQTFDFDDFNLPMSVLLTVNSNASWDGSSWACGTGTCSSLASFTTADNTTTTDLILSELVSGVSSGQTWYLMVGGETATNPINQSNTYEVRISETPIPAAVWLFGSALLGVGGLSSRRKSLPAETLAA